MKCDESDYRGTSDFARIAAVGIVRGRVMHPVESFNVQTGHSIAGPIDR